MRPLALFVLACVALALVLPSDRLRFVGFHVEDGEPPSAEPNQERALEPEPKAAAQPHEQEVLFDDTGSDKDAEGLWGSIDCDLDDTPPAKSGVEVAETGGDTAPRGDGSDQGNTAYRIVRVNDGDDFFGERCELGRNDRETGPTALYEDGDRLITYASFRLPPSFPLQTPEWQGVLQIKQVQPADNADGTPVLSLGAYGGRWILFHSGPGFTEEDQELWSAAAVPGVWARFAIDVTLSPDPAVGRVTVNADLDGDGLMGEAGETSPTFEVNTLKVETAGSDEDGFEEGDPLPSHLRVGIYHNPVIPCPGGCRLDVDNVQVLRP